MAETRDPRGSEEIARRIKEALGGVAAPPGLRQRIRAALDEEDARPARSGAPGRFGTLLRRPSFLMALAASLLAILAISRMGGGDRPAGNPVRLVRAEGTVVCYDCAREGEPLEYQIRECGWPNHTNGLQLNDGGLWRFVIREPLGETLLARSMRGRRVRVEGDLYAAIAHLDVKSFVPLARCHVPRRAGAFPVL
jgi:hypothetical protein